MIQTEKKRQIKTVTCPYMPQHIMPESSLLNHLTKCTAKNKHLFTKCRYNPLHIYPNELINNHYKKCKSKAQFEKYNKNADSSDDWDVDDDNNTDSNNQKQLQVVPSRLNSRVQNTQLVIQHSTIQQKTFKSNLSENSSQNWDLMVSDDEDLELTQKQMQNMSINSGNSHKNKKNQSSMQSYSLQEAPNSSLLKINDSKLEINSSKQNKSISSQLKKKSFINTSDNFEDEQSKLEKRSKRSKKGNQTLESISQSENSRDNRSIEYQSSKNSSRLQVDFEVEDF